MDFSLPASPQTRRPVTPQDFAAGSSNCQELLKLAKLVKGYAISIEGCQKGINGLLQAGLTDLNHPTMLDYTRVLEDYNQRYQQAVSEFTSRPPCDTPQTVNFIPPQLTLPLKLTTHRIFLSPETISKTKRKYRRFHPPPPLRKLSKNITSSSNPELNFNIELANKFSELEKITPQTHQVAITHIPTQRQQLTQ
ncbi:hypothetical protein TNIN_395531 [Trichonephila inaurata madagascariensis]|uniref:Uncharacterized protein n=1 Tax=Trichonephila inaurata madagascariensis TaxID=2747483 RepID=A0A8X6WWB1_9ARAC|nr:hypothetical protein TNIN_395531 [Trichonephila inaurata madagascariensis]